MSDAEINALVLEWQRSGSRRAGNSVARYARAMVLKQSMRVSCSDADRDSLIGEGFVGLARAMRRWTSGGPPFMPYAQLLVARAMANYAQSYTRKKRVGKRREVGFEPTRLPSYEAPADAALMRDAVELAVREFRTGLTERERIVFDARTSPEPLTLKQTGTLIGASHEGVRQIERRVMAVARERLGGLR